MQRQDITTRMARAAAKRSIAKDSASRVQSGARSSYAEAQPVFAGTVKTALTARSGRLVLTLLIALLTTATAWAETETLGGYNFTVETDGDDSYYKVDCKEALVALSTYAQSNDCAGKTFVQTADITLTGTFNPIGGNSSKNYEGFKGIYDGGGHTISGLNVSVTSTSWSFAVAGLFGCISNGGTVRNVGLIAPTVSCSTSMDKNRAGAIAGLVQYSETSVTHCFVLNPGSITASGGSANYAGLFFGVKNNSGTYANLYYYGTTSLPMCGYGDIGSNHIEQIHKVTAGTNVGLPATADETGFIASEGHYYRQGASLELSYTGSNPNYYRPVYSVSPTGTGATVLSRNVLTVGNADITVSATLSSEQLIDIATGTLASIPDQMYTGSPITPAITLTVGGKVLTETFTMPAKNVSVTATFTPDPAHFSQSGDEYTIHTAEGWGVFCDALQENTTYNRFSGKTVKLGANITVSRMAGSDSHDFCGTFDGGGKTLTFNYGTSSSTPATAPTADSSPTTINTAISPSRAACSTASCSPRARRPPTVAAAS